MSIVILSRHDDRHSQIMHACMTDLGVPSVLFLDDGYPSESTVSVDPLSGTIWSHDVKNLYATDVIWNRRIGKPKISSGLHEDDREIANGICQVFLRDVRNINSGLWNTGTWVNSYTTQMLYDNKLNQLRASVASGLTVPATLVSNNPVDIREFARKYQKCIVKPLRHMVWAGDGDAKFASPTSILPDLRDIDDISLQSCPMIYQECISRSSDIRIIVFNHDIYAVEIVPCNELKSNEVDWRPSGAGDTTIRPFELPKKLEDLIRGMCIKARLLHCSIDLGLSDDGDFVFFEINVQGQWLWIEKMNPDIRMLEAFARMVCGMSSEKLVPFDRIEAANYFGEFY